MDGWGDAEARTWLAMDLLAPVHDLRALELVPGPGGEAPPAVQALAEGLLGEHRPELTDAALAGLLDLERALVVGGALEMARGLVEPDVLVLVECALVDEACRLSLLPLVNAAADLLVELGREAAQHETAQHETAQNETAQNETAQHGVGQKEVGEQEAVQCDPDRSLGLVGSAHPAVLGDPVPAEAAAGARRDERAGGRVVARVVSGRGSCRPDQGRGPVREPVVTASIARGGARSRAPPPGRGCPRRWVPGSR